MRHLFSAIIVVTALSLFAGASQAVTVDVRDSAATPDFYVPGTSSSSLRATTNGGSYTNITTGTFDLEADYGGGFQSLVTYCLEANQGITFGQNPPDTVGKPYELGSLTTYSAFTASEIDTLQTLWHYAFTDSQTSTRKAAAFQAIIWEMAIDNVLNFGSGNFKINTLNSFTNDVYNIASSWLTNISNSTWTEQTQLFVLTNSKSQDYLTTVPEPASLSLLALGALAILPRRRRQRAA